MRLIRTQWLALVVATLVVALPAQAFVSAGYLCQMRGRVYTACCCGVERVSETHGPILKQPDCCRFVSVERTASPAEDSTFHGVPASAAVALLAIDLVSNAAAKRHSWAAPSDTHPPGPPRFLANCAWLI